MKTQYRIRLTCPGGTVHLAPAPWHAARLDAKNRVRLAQAGTSTAEAVELLVRADGVWQVHSRLWHREEST